MSKSDLVYRADCPSRIVLDQIADKWSMMVLEVLREPQRFNAIKRRLDGVTQRVLTQTLRKLERNGMVKRKVLDGRVLGVEYSLTPLGQSLQEPFSLLFNWTLENIDTIQRCQKLYDAESEYITGTLSAALRLYGRPGLSVETDLFLRSIAVGVDIPLFHSASIQDRIARRPNLYLRIECFNTNKHRLCSLRTPRTMSHMR